MSVENSQTFRVNPKPDSSFDYVIKEQVSTTENFVDSQAADSTYSQRLDKLTKDIRYQELKQGLVIVGGIIGGIGVAAIARSNELSLGSPNTYIGVDLLAAGMYLAHSGLAAVNKEEELRSLYERTQKRWEHIRAWADKRKITVRNLVKSKEEVVFAPRVTKADAIAESPRPEGVLVQANVIVNNPDQSEREIEINPVNNTKEPGHILSEKIKSAMSGEVLVNESDPFVTPSTKDLIKHYEWRDQVIERERKFLKEVGIIPEHKCSGEECGICAGYNPIFL